MLTFYLFLQRVCRFIKQGAEWVRVKIPRISAVFISAVSVIAMTVLASAFPGTGTGNSVAMAETVRSYSGLEAQLLAGNLLEADVKKRQETDELLKIRAEETKKEFLGREREKAQIKAEAEREAKAKMVSGAEAAEKVKAAETAEISGTAAAAGISDEDYRVLLKIVEAEAGICDEKGRILVANVIMNRVKSGKFPDSVKSVVYQPSQFSPVRNGFIDRVEVTEKTKKSVNRALAGEDYSKGALYFMNRGKSQKGAVSWFDSHLTYLFEHGGHEFFK